jgi:RHS repeat-associated protein
LKLDLVSPNPFGIASLRLPPEVSPADQNRIRDYNRLTQITQGTSTVGFSYDTANRRSTLTLSNGVNMSYTYDNDSRVTGITYKFNANTLGNLTYSYDSLGRRTQVGGSFAQTGLPGAVTSASYDAANELLNWNDTNISYDLNGNMLSDGSNTFTWNARNQVAALNNVSLQYDAAGRRTRNAAGKSFLYDGANATQELVNGNVTANIFTGGIDQVFQRADGSGTVVPITDALGSVLALADANGNLTTYYSYDPFGNTTVSGAANTNPSQYTGRENEGTGLYYYRARYYSPLLGRFVSEDPKGFAAGINFYRYVDDNPLNFFDPFGMDKNKSEPCNGVIVPGIRSGDEMGGGMGLIAGGSLAGGVGPGAAATGGIGHGLFWGKGSGLNYGSFSSFGALAGGDNVGSAYPGTPTDSPSYSAGLFGGLGAGVFFTNGGNSDTLGNSFNVSLYNFGPLEVQKASSGDVWQTSYIVGPGFGFGMSHLTTNTWPAHGCVTLPGPDPWDETDPHNYGVQD